MVPISSIPYSMMRLIISTSPVMLSLATSLDSFNITSSPAAGLPAIVMAAEKAEICLSFCANYVSVALAAVPTAVSMASLSARPTPAKSKSMVSVVNPAVFVQSNLNLIVPAFQFGGVVH